MRRITTLLLGICWLSSCNQQGSKQSSSDTASSEKSIFEVAAAMETAPIKSVHGTDAADDPAIWIHPEDPSQSFIYGSNKTGGIAAYKLSGEEVAYAEVGRINNIDVSYGLKLMKDTIDICGGTNRTTNAIDIFRIDPQSGQLTYILDTILPSQVDEVYGFCFYHSPLTSKSYAILCGKNGLIEQYEILEGQEKLSLELVRSFAISSQPEGLVADHKLGFLYVGEEGKGVWKLNAEPVDPKLELLPNTSEETNSNITYDIEGLTIYYTTADQGYLIVSSQGNNSYAVYNRHPGNEYLGSFRITDGAIDGTYDTDGIDVTNLNMGPAFPQGLFIAQDGNNTDGDTNRPQNFKVLGWNTIASLFDPPLQVDTTFNIRSLFE